MIGFIVVRIVKKDHILIKNGGIWWSNGLAPQSNDRCGDWPRDLFVWLPECGNEIWSTWETGKRNGRVVEIAKKRRFWGQCQKVSLTTHEDRE